MKIRNLAVVSLLLLALTLAACTRQASTATVPSQSPAQPTTNVAEDPTMAAVRQTAAVRATEAVVETQAAVALGAGGGAEGTPEATPAENELPSATPAEAGTSVVSPEATETETVAVPTATAAPTVACPNPYVVQQGDWIYRIARQCNVGSAALLAANPGVNPNYIIPGQKLNMPSSPAVSAACTGSYTVVKGDTLYNIAYRCGLTTEQLAAVNTVVYPFVIYPGDVLKFP